MSVGVNEKKKLNRTVVAGATPQEKLYYIMDVEIIGLSLIVYPSGSKTYVFDYRMGRGRKFPKQRITIGSATKFSPEQAREKAKGYLAQVIKGEDPGKEEQERKNKHSFKEAWERYIEEYVKLKNKPSTQKMIIGRGKSVILPYFKGKNAEDITSHDIHNFMLSRKETAKIDANRCRAYLSKMFSLCERPWEIRPLNTNPCKGTLKYDEKRRDRYLSDDELVRLIRVLDDLIKDNVAECMDKFRQRALYRIRVACYFKLILFTGARGIEWRDAKIEDIDTGRMILRPETTKNDEPAIALPPEVIEILEFLLSLPQPEENPYLFPGKYNRGHMTSPKEMWHKIAKDSQLKNFRPHDLRHSWAAFALASGLSLADVGQQLNHKTYQTTKRYEHLADKVKQKNVASVGSAITSISAGEAKIVDIRTRKRPGE